jgi:CBS domain-containing protein
MKVKDVMATAVATCAPGTTLAEAGHLMWEADCGFLPVVKDGALAGVVTDRDMYIALATRDARASGIAVDAVATKQVVTCAPEDDVRTALETMRQARVRRLPVAGFGGTVLGILSMNDIVRAVGDGNGIAAEDVVETLQAICAHHHPVVAHVVAA